MLSFPLSSHGEIPGTGHPGSFGFIRKHHIHEGIDLYGQPNESVFAINSGLVVAEYAFTGASVGMPWWNETRAVAIEDATGIWVYGEIDPDGITHVGQEIFIGQYIGKLIPVLKVDKGRPMTMLHLERWKLGSLPFTFLWQLNQPKPDFLLDPTPLLKEI